MESPLRQEDIIPADGRGKFVHAEILHRTLFANSYLCLLSIHLRRLFGRTERKVTLEMTVWCPSTARTARSQDKDKEVRPKQRLSNRTNSMAMVSDMKLASASLQETLCV